MRQPGPWRVEEGSGCRALGTRRSGNGEDSHGHKVETDTVGSGEDNTRRTVHSGLPSDPSVPYTLRTRDVHLLRSCKITSSWITSGTANMRA